jgi:hypothetical protein
MNELPTSLVPLRERLLVRPGGIGSSDYWRGRPHAARALEAVEANLVDNRGMGKKPPPKPPKEHPFEEYIVYRHRLKHFLQLHDVMIHVLECPNRSPHQEELLGTLRLLGISFLAGFFDRRDDSLKVFDVWREYLPKHRAALDRAERRLAPLMNKAREIRNKVGAHSDLSITAQNQALAGLPQGNAAELLTRFLEVADLITKAEHEEPGLAKEIEDWGLPRGADMPL